MKISRIILKGVNNFEDFDYSFEDEWSNTVPASLLLLGPNGSGKTTILKAIETLWLAFREFFTTPLELHQDQHLSPTLFGFEDCNLAAIEITDLLSAPLLVTIGESLAVDALFSTAENQHKFKIAALFIRHRTVARGTIEWKFEPSDNNNLLSNGENTSANWVTELNQRFVQNRLGAVSDLPNLVVFESEQRVLLEIEDEFSAIPEQEIYQWRASYSATKRYQGSIQNYLFTLKAIKPEVYQRVIQQVNNFLANKSIVGFSEKSGQLLVETNSGQTHPVHLLSSGEKQVLLMIAFIARELRPGGIVLIDEPDLHLHVSLSTAFVSHLKQMVAGQNGQLIIASHAPELWERFTQAERVELGAVAEAV